MGLIKNVSRMASAYGVTETVQLARTVINTVIVSVSHLFYKGMNAIPSSVMVRPSVSVGQFRLQDVGEILRPCPNRVPIAVIAFRPDAQQHTHSEQHPLA